MPSGMAAICAEATAGVDVKRLLRIASTEVAVGGKRSSASGAADARLWALARSAVYRPKPVARADDLAVMRRIDELHLELPFYGSRRMTFELNKEVIIHTRLLTRNDAYYDYYYANYYQSRNQ